MSIGLPPPVCPMGYNWLQLVDWLGADECVKLRIWLQGKTFDPCVGEMYDEASNTMVRSSCPEGGHGTVVYPVDVERYLVTQRGTRARQGDQSGAFPKTDPHSHHELPPEPAPTPAIMVHATDAIMAFARRHPEIATEELTSLLNAITEDCMGSWQRGWSEARVAVEGYLASLTDRARGE